MLKYHRTAAPLLVATLLSSQSGCATRYTASELSQVSVIPQGAAGCNAYETYGVDGLPSLFATETIEVAIEQAQSRALGTGGDCVQLSHTVKAAEDTDEGFTPYVAGVISALSSSDNVDKAMDSWANADVDPEQIFWYFNIGHRVQDTSSDQDKTAQ